jgi:endonuclease/exonuclease/phosphatase family metal-dependent hydrolase
MVELAAADGPDVVCLQEVPPWSLPRLERWSGMQAVGAVAQPPRLGPVPWTALLGRAVTALNHGLFRSAVEGQANALLLTRAVQIVERRTLVLNAARFRRAQATWLELGVVARLAWAKERRVCQAARVVLPDGRTALVANLHATSYPADQRLADAEVLRAAVFADGLAGSADLCVLAGDFNVPHARSRTLADLREWGFSEPAPGIDQVLVRGAASSPVERWPDGRRRTSDGLLSDHAPVEARVE